MIVTSSGKIIAGPNRIIVSDTINEFLGTVSNLWNNPANWSLSIVPIANHIAIIKADCMVNILVTSVKLIIVDINVTLTLNQIISQTYGLINNGTIINNFRLHINYMAGFSVFQPNNYTELGGGNLYFLFNAPNPNPLIPYLPVANYKGVNNLFYSIIDFEHSFDSLSNFFTANKNIEVNTLNGLINQPNPTTLKINTLWYQGGFVTSSHVNSVVEMYGNTLWWYGNTSLTTILIKGTTLSCAPSNVVNGTASVNRLIVEGELTIQRYNATIGTPILNINYITGLNSLSKLKLIGNSTDPNSIPTINYNGSEDFYPTGILEFSGDYEFAVYYNRAGVQNIKPMTYKRLGVTNSGIKKLTGNVVCEHLYFAGTATLDLNGFTLTGYTKYTDARNRASTVPLGSYTNVEFKDENLNTVQTLTSGSTIDELIWRGGNFTVGTNTPVFALNGVNPAQWRFIRQFSQQINNITFTFSNVRLEIESGTPGGLTLNNSNITITGTLDFKRNGLVILNGTSLITCNTLSISLTGAQDIPANVGFTNLTVSGSGMKTLTGNIVVTGTYYRDTVNTTFNKNGFTIKNSSGVDLE